MSLGAAVLGSLAALPLSPSPAPGRVVDTPDPALVTPGTLGFLAIFAVGVALVLLVRDMVRRNRTIVVRAERRDQALRASSGGDPVDREGLGGDVGDGSAADGDQRSGGPARGTRPEQPRTPRERLDRDGQGPAAPNG